ncbi:hypothetical protein L3Q82_005321 [Scortum barcoo]|uniref:Uncharacterized protein n=1 Tax=Scortum barcoo TaxID=214431 RepID=A0ACB8V9V3_9TELE|nr:hypothetical protein L3Q82_005321 [Scortum barcoo]
MNFQPPSSPQVPAPSGLNVVSDDSSVTWDPPDEDTEPPPISIRPKSTFKQTALPILTTPGPIKVETKLKVEQAQNTLSPLATPFMPHNPHTPASTSHPAEPFAQYMARRDLVTSGLYQYDDRPENFRAWYSSFAGAIAEVHLTPTQELDLMTKWLGKESSNQVKRIRSVHVTNPTLALQKAWERLHECYAAPEIIEKSLFQRLDNFARLTIKDNVKLRELGDLLQEIQGAKEDGYLPGLSYLDTSRGIGPIVDKLPYALQEKWMSQGCSYKEENNGCFPPFKYFCKFICKEAKKRNDPSFTQQNSQMHIKPERPNLKSFNSAKPIAVHKTMISTPNKDINKNCPLHNKPHPLKKCRTFRNKLLDERKAFLKEKEICFKCCSSDTHLAKDCRSTVKCTECDSTNHDSVMHPGPPPQMNKDPPPAEEDGVEGENQPDNVQRKPQMQEQYVEFMEGIFSNGHAEVAPPLKQGEECWYLPTFGVYHPQKPNKIRVVFDSSAQYSGVSLNNVLLSGPDLNNSLIGVLLRFRKETVAIMADIQQMFHCFMVREDHRNYLRFLWHKDNDVNKEVIEYRMKVHVFGNSPSPAVAVYGLRKAIQAGAKDHGADTVKFVDRHFYVERRLDLCTFSS